MSERHKKSSSHKEGETMNRDEIIRLNDKLVSTIEDVLRLNKLYMGQVDDEVPQKQRDVRDVSHQSQSDALAQELTIHGRIPRMVLDVVSNAEDAIHVREIVYKVEVMCKKERIKSFKQSSIRDAIQRLYFRGALERVSQGLYRFTSNPNFSIRIGKDAKKALTQLTKQAAILNILNNANKPLTLREIRKELTSKYGHHAGDVSQYLWTLKKRGILQGEKSAGYIMYTLPDEEPEKKKDIRFQRRDAILDILSRSNTPLNTKQIADIIDRDYPHIPRNSDDKANWNTVNHRLGRLTKLNKIKRVAPGIYGNVSV